MPRPHRVLAAVSFGLLIACDGGGQAIAPGDAAAPADAAQADAVPVSTEATPFSDTCTPTGAAGHQMRTWGSNAAELEGPLLGAGSLDVTSLRKQLPARLIEPNPMFAIGNAYLTRRSLDGIGVDFIAEVRFLGAGTACFVQAIDIAWLSSDGAIVRASPSDPERETAFVDGSVGLASGRTATSTCLTTGELGYIIDLRLGPLRGSTLYDQIAAVELRVGPSWIPGGRPSATVHATSYVACQEFRQIEVALESRGPQPAVFDDDNLGSYLLFDDGGAPLTWGFLNTRRGLGRYAPGKVMVGGATLFYEGASRRMQMLADFSVSLLTPSARDRGDGARAQALEQMQAEHQQFAARRRARWQALRAGR